MLVQEYFAPQTNLIMFFRSCIYYVNIALILGTSTLCFGTTYIGQSIEKDSKWYKKQGPYIITIDLSIHQGATLTIEPGTQVFFAKETFMTVAGNLVAKGTKAQKISFGGLNNADWGGFRFTRDCNDYNPTNQEGVCFEYCQFKGSGNHPTHLIKSNGCNINLLACQIFRCYTAVQIDRQAELWLRNSLIEHCNRAINVKNTSVATIENNKMIACNSILLGGSTLFRNNVLKKFTAQGRHSGLIVWMKGGGKIEITNNKFLGFEAYALKLEKTSNRSTFILKYNNFKHNSSNLKLSCQYYKRGSSIIVNNNFFNCKDHQVCFFEPCSEKASEALNIGTNYWGKLDQKSLHKATILPEKTKKSSVKIIYAPLSKKSF